LTRFWVLWCLLGMVNAPPTVHLSEGVLELVARRMQLLSDPFRLRLLLALQGGGEASVQQLADAVGSEHRGASRNLNALWGDGLLVRRRVGTRVLYSLADYTVCRIIAQAAQGVAAHVEELSDRVLDPA
jgi:DNA-binding transcriptional ArsR family regulator